jgi:hypothetical protein
MFSTAAATVFFTGALTLMSGLTPKEREIFLSSPVNFDEIMAAQSSVGVAVLVVLLLASGLALSLTLWVGVTGIWRAMASLTRRRLGSEIGL